jgi:hypothetical protein
MFRMNGLDPPPQDAAGRADVAGFDRSAFLLR